MYKVAVSEQVAIVNPLVQVPIRVGTYNPPTVYNLADPSFSLEMVSLAVELPLHTSYQEMIFM